MNGVHRTFAGESYEYMYKILLVGDAGVGKTSLLLRFKEGSFTPGNYIATVGIDFKSKVIEVDERRVKLQMWDTAGQERFRSITKAYYRDSHAIMLIYDIRSQMSFQNIRSWLSQIRSHAPDQTVLMLVGNKMDCESSERQVSYEAGQQLGAECGIVFMETSAKAGTGVELAFQTLTREMIRLIGCPRNFTSRSNKIEQSSVDPESRDRLCCR